MKTQEWRDLVHLRATLPPGPWTSEPDRAQWPDEATGLPCLLVRHPDFGTLCGYVGVPPGHPAFGLEDLDPDAPTHWGITYSGPCEGRICHEPGPGEPDQVWWLGFDCGHAFDAYPSMPRVPGTYRDVAFVRERCTELAAYLAGKAA